MAIYESGIAAIVRMVIVLLVTIPVLILFGLSLRKPGYSQDNTRRWVNFTKPALGFWGLSQALQIISVIIILAAGLGSTYEYDHDAAVTVLVYLAALFEYWAHACIFLAQFYLAHALTQLRGEDYLRASAYRKGRIVALITASLIAILAFVFFCLALSVSFDSSYRSSSGRRLRRLVAQSLDVACLGLLVLSAIGAVVYSAKSRKKALGSSVHKAANILVTISSLWLVRVVWLILSWFFGGRGYYYGFIIIVILDIFAGIILTFSILTMLYLLATRPVYGMSRAEDRRKLSQGQQSV
ncbi:uncharacterized protein CTRU02_210673 [Colletotrichum truncatum]|uniref:Uncharacterized protein n=1 Tax=Colletotrichum truncatum TaxID=5467 RepID=A0ACC3YPP3_COLTU|nr:uncharacterized protein CTRU02_03833 [Colletotrichum truncatum]KAF6796855.1 hypothetical protein CTRU02_03833 [Colletotrichum truncatum]